MSSTESAAVSRAERITALVLEVQSRRARGIGETDVTRELLRLVSPTLKYAARRFPKTSRGALDLEDLEQIGALATLKFIDRFKYGRGSSTFEAMLGFEVMRACRDQVRLHAQAVKGPWRGGASITTVAVEDTHAVDASSPEAQLAEAGTLQALFRGLNKLSPERRDIVQRLYGIGGAAQSMRSLGRKGRRSDRHHLARERDAALTELRSGL